MVFGKFKNYPIFRYIIYDFLKKVSRGSRPTCLAKILCARVTSPPLPLPLPVSLPTLPPSCSTHPTPYSFTLPSPICFCLFSGPYFSLSLFILSHLSLQQPCLHQLRLTQMTQRHVDTRWKFGNGILCNPGKVIGD